MLFGLIKTFQAISSTNYGVRIVDGTYGQGKTKYTFMEARVRKENNPDGLVIANINYDFVDIYFNSVQDFYKIMEYFSQYVEETNPDEILQTAYFRPVLFIIDECHLYLGARNFKSNMTEELETILTQCRKRNMQLVFITQHIAQMDVYIRRVSPQVVSYRSLLGLITRATVFYYKMAGVTDMADSKNVDIVGQSFIPPDRYLRLTKKYLKPYFDQRFRTRKVVGLENRIKLTYPDIRKLLNLDEIISNAYSL